MGAFLDLRNQFVAAFSRVFIPGIFAAGLLAVVGLANAGTEQYHWSHDNLPAAATLIQEDGSNVLRIENTTGKSLTVPLVVIENPSLGNDHYEVKGDVRYENVEGEAYLETLNWFGKGKSAESFFSKTLNPTGAMGVISGTSDWRDYRLPFFPKNGPPAKIELNLVMPGSGTVFLSGFMVTNENIEGGSHAWLNASWGGVVGSVFGVITGILGMIGGMGKARRFVMLMLWLMLFVGVSLLCVGIAALFNDQPYYVWYPGILIGVLTLILYPFVLIPRIKQSYEQMELRKISSTDTLTAG